MLNFTDAIQEVEKQEAAPSRDQLLPNLLKYLQDKHPKLAVLVAKDLTAGDVHATTALGNDGKPKKPKSFKEMLSVVTDPTKIVVTDGEGAEKRWSIPFTITKAAPEQQLIFGWASVAEKNGQLIVDKQDDVILPEDLEKAAYDFVLYSRRQGDMHNLVGTGRLVESMMFTKQKQDVLGIDLGLQGWWVGFKVDDQRLWHAIKSGDRPQFSIGGRGVREAM